MKKKILAIVLLSFLVVGVVSAAVNGVYKGKDIVKVTFNGEAVPADTVPGYLESGSTMIPLGLLRKMGFEVDWNNKTLTANVKVGEDEKAQEYAKVNERLLKIQSAANHAYQQLLLNQLVYASIKENFDVNTTDDSVKNLAKWHTSQINSLTPDQAFLNSVKLVDTSYFSDIALLMNQLTKSLDDATNALIEYKKATSLDKLKIYTDSSGSASDLIEKIFTATNKYITSK
jgi:hypothetical protein